MIQESIHSGVYLENYKVVSLMDILKIFQRSTAKINKQITRLIISAVKRSFRNRSSMRRDVSQISSLNSGNNSR
jgi:hypothetical protein